MKLKISFVLFINSMLCVFSACNNEVKKEETVTTIESAAGAAVMLFKEEKHNFGTINQGEKVSYSFRFTNAGKSDLIISSAHGSCGCTVPTYPKEPIKPGIESKIDVVFDSDGKSGLVEKTVTLYSNCIPNSKILIINANIIVPK